MVISSRFHPDLAAQPAASRTLRNWGVRFFTAAALFLASHAAFGQSDTRMVILEGTIRDEAGQASPNATVVVAKEQGRADENGHYSIRVPVGHDLVEVQVGNAIAFGIALDIESDRNCDIDLREGNSVTASAQQDVLTPDPSTQGFAHAELLEANPGRPGVPISVPGYPVETASGGIKAPQYFAPGVAGDHGEPIGQYLNISSFLLPNNLTANAHGNGYADPNFLVSGILGGVIVDGGAFNVRYGDHAINLAVTYDLRSDVPSTLQASTTGKDVSFGGTWHLGQSSWIAGEALLGNGWLQRREERQQYKLNALHDWSAGRHQFTLFGAGYYGFSRIPGLIPLDVAVPNGTIDGRQSDLTHTTVVAFVDRWQLSLRNSLTTGAFFRTYSLDLRSNFGDGLIRQSEFRTVAGGSTNYTRELSNRWTLLAGFEARREAPRALDLQRFDETAQRFNPVSSNDLTIYTAAPLAAISGRPMPGVRIYAGARRDQLCFDNSDLLQRSNSFHSCPGFTSPKVNLTFGSLQQRFLPQIGLSFAKAFHANDPRIGSGSQRGQLIATAREYQFVATKTLGNVQGRLVLGQVGTSAEFAKIDPDTGLQENVGPALNRFLTVQVNQRTAEHFWQVSWSQADARDREDGAPLPEAPRMIVDAAMGTRRLPFGLSGKTEFEYVKAKPLGDGFIGTPLRELRMELSRSFRDGRWTASVNGQWMNGFSGQTLETLSLDSSVAAFARPVGVPVASYATLGLRYNFSR